MRIELYRMDYGDDGMKRYPHNAMTTRQIVALHLNGGEVSIKTSSRLTGNNKVSGKRYWRWVTDEVVKIRRGARGQMVPYHYNHGKHYGGWTAYHTFKAVADRYINVLDDDLKDTVAGMFEITDDSMPVHAALGADRGHNPRGTFDLYQRDPADFVKTLFGKSRYRKDLAKATFESKADMVLIAATMRDLVPTDWLVGFLRQMHERDVQTGIRYNMENPLAFRAVAKQLDRRVLRRLLTNAEGFSRYEIADVSRFSDRLGDTSRVRSWHDLHGLIGRTPRHRLGDGYIQLDYPAYVPPPPPPDVKIDQTYITKKLITAFMGSKYVLVPAESSEQLRGWSNEMGNCIRGYDQVAAKGETNLGALMFEGKMLANYEIDESGRLKQLLGKFNKNLPDEHRLEIEQLMIKAGVNVVHYWGKPEPALHNLNHGVHHAMDFAVPAPMPIDMMALDW